MRENYNRIHKEMIKSSIKEQDYGKEDFEITPVLPVCNKTNPSTSHKKENNCQALEQIEADITLSGDTHMYLLTNLKPHTTYRISIRACVNGLVNGCGPETLLWAETVSKTLDTILGKIKFTTDSPKWL